MPVDPWQLNPHFVAGIIISLGCMVLGSLVIGGGSIVAVNGMHQDLSITVRGYEQLRQVFNVGLLVSNARAAIADDPPRPAQAIIALQSAMSALDTRSDFNVVDGAPDKWVDESPRTDCRRLIAESISQLKGKPDSQPAGSASLNQIFSRLSKTAQDVRRAIADAQTTADRRRKMTLVSVISLVGMVNLAAILIGIRHYHRVIGPIQQLAEGVRGFAAGELDRRIKLTGDREFVSLAEDFDQMAQQLSSLYKDLEARVASKSKELVQSQQLAGFGYLAAGVAHEINNPLGIIAGYAERAMQQLAQGSSDATLSQTNNALSIICEEAFRCKQITASLLSLARPGSEDRQIVSLAGIAQTVISNLSALGTIQHRAVTLTLEPNTDASVFASEGQMKQLLLNLLMNAIEAVDPETGKIQMSIASSEPHVELSIADNGHGMTPETLDRIFQPFFSNRRGQVRGTGLGLSIAQSIVTAHGGIIRAQSEGAGKGSIFTVSLPAAKQEPIVETA